MIPFTWKSRKDKDIVAEPRCVIVGVRDGDGRQPVEKTWEDFSGW